MLLLLNEGLNNEVEMENRKKETAGIILRAVIAMILFVVAIVNYEKL